MSCSANSGHPMKIEIYIEAANTVLTQFGIARGVRSMLAMKQLASMEKWGEEKRKMQCLHENRGGSTQSAHKVHTEYFAHEVLAVLRS